MAISQPELDALLAEDAAFARIWTSLGDPLQQAWQRTLTVDKLREILLKRKALLPATEARAAELTEKKKQFLAYQPAAANSLSPELDKLLSAFGLGGIGVASLVAHPSSVQLYCPPAVLADALKNADVNVAVSVETGRPGAKGTIYVVFGDPATPLLEVTIQPLDDEKTLVLIGSQNGLATANVVAGKASQVVGALKKVFARGGMDVASKVGQLFKSGVLEQAHEAFVLVALKGRLWQIVEEAAKPFEEKYFEQLAADKRAQIEEKRRAQAEAARSCCPACGTSYSVSARDTRVCDKCNFPVPPDAILPR